MARVLTYCLELTEGPDFSRGLWEPDEPAQLLRELEGERIHRGDDIELYALHRALVSALAARLERRVKFALSVTDRLDRRRDSRGPVEGITFREQR